MSAAVASRLCLQLTAQQRQRMPAEGQPQCAVIGDDVLALGRRGEGGRRFGERRARAGKDGRQFLHAGDVPHGRVPMAGERGQRARRRERGEIAPVELRAMREVGHVRERQLRARRDDALRAFLLQSADHAQAKAQRWNVVLVPLTPTLSPQAGRGRVQRNAGGWPSIATQALRRDLPLPACGERVGVRGRK